MDYSLSGEEVLKLCDGKARLVVYEELYNFKTLDELLHPWGSVILLYEYKRDGEGSSYGHYVCLNVVPDEKGGTTVEHFDSLGYKPDEELFKIGISPDFAVKSRQDKQYLLRLLINSGYPISYNEYHLQEDKKGINTCGRWCGVRVFLKNLSLDTFAGLFMNKKLPSDLLITILTSPKYIER
jgi:hypothetical protein